MFELHRIITFNRSIDAGLYSGTFQSPAKKKRLVEQCVKSSVSTLESVSNMANLITNEQLFSGGNHRAALKTFYYYLIYSLRFCPRVRPYEAYACIDYDRSLFEQGRGGNSLFLEVSKRGKNKLNTPTLQTKYWTLMEDEIDRLHTELLRISIPIGPELTISSKSNWDRNIAAKEAMKENGGAEYSRLLALQYRRKNFIKLHGDRLGQYF